MDNIKKVLENLEKQFLADNRPWVVTFSGGKDSTLVLHLTILMLLELKKEGLKPKKVYVMSSDTGVEMPIVEIYHFSKMKELETFVKKEDLNVEVKIVEPKVEDSFWVCLLGKGYPSPNMMFRWCTQRIKINPTTSYLGNILASNETIIMLLGVRNDESDARAESIEKRELNQRELTIHESLPNAYTYMPIKDISTSDLWTFLSNNKAPWGTHNDMMALYEKGSGEADCNIIMHPNSKSCGKTRFGCWTCTVVEKDSSMQGAIANGETWMIPMADFRDKLHRYRYDHTKRREKSKTGDAVSGAFLLDVRKELFRELLEIEQSLKSHFEQRGYRTKLLSDEQIITINMEHKKDGDFCDDVLKIANEYGRNFNIVKTELNDDVLELCEKNDLDPCILNELLKEGHKHRHSLKRLGIKKQQDKLITAFVQGVVHEDK